MLAATSTIMIMKYNITINDHKMTMFTIAYYLISLCKLFVYVVYLKQIKYITHRCSKTQANG